MSHVISFHCLVIVLFFCKLKRENWGDGREIKHIQTQITYMSVPQPTKVKYIFIHILNSQNLGFVFFKPKPINVNLLVLERKEKNF